MMKTRSFSTKLSIGSIGAALLLATALLGCGGSKSEAKSAGAAPVERLKEVDDTIAAFKKKDATIADLFSKSAGYVVIPTIGEGGFIVGGAHGAGEAFESGAFVGRVTLSEVSVGALVGGQSYSQVIFFETPVDFKRLKDNSFQFGAEVNA